AAHAGDFRFDLPAIRRLWILARPAGSKSSLASPRAAVVLAVLGRVVSDFTRRVGIFGNRRGVVVRRDGRLLGHVVRGHIVDGPPRRLAASPRIVSHLRRNARKLW